MSNSYLNLWIEQALSRSSSAMKAKITVVGTRDAHLGAMCQFARIAVSIVPSSTLEIIDEVPATEELRAFGYPEWAVFGLLDVLVAADPFPLGRVRIKLKKAQYHPVDSSPMAFRHAGRDAGRQIVDKLYEQMRY